MNTLAPLPIGAGTPAPAAPWLESARTLLGKLLNQEWATRHGALLQPFARTLRPSVAAAAHALPQLAHVAARAPRTVADLEHRLAATFRDHRVQAATTATQVVTVPAIPADLRAWRDPGFPALAAAARTLANRTGARVLLHGSLASDDWTGYRDADLLLLVDAATCADAAALRRLRQAALPLLRALYAFDPLQHHGLFVVPAAELAAWPEHVLPVASLQRAVDLGGDGVSLAVRPHRHALAAQAEFAWLVDYFRTANAPHDAYSWKAFLSVLMLVPAIFLGAQGQPVWKAESFARVRALVPASLWQPQLDAAALRQRWQTDTPSWLRRLLRIAPDPRFLAQVARRHTRLRAGILPVAGDELLRRARALVAHLQSLTNSTSGNP